MDFVTVVGLLLKFATTMAEGQTEEQRKIIWDWFIKDVTWWRVHFKIDKPEKDDAPKRDANG